MKVKSAVLASALVAVSSVFAADITAPWFTKTPTGNEGSIDCELNSPVIVNGNAAAVANYYAVTANVSIIIHAALPQPSELTLKEGNNTFNPKGSICAAVDGVTTNWYGLKYEGSGYVWTALATAENAAFTTPANNTEYTLVTEFDDITDNAHRVRYWVGGQCSKWYTSGHADALKKVGLAGTGTYTKVIGLIAYSVAQTTGTIPITIDTSTLNDMGVTATTASEIVAALTTPQNNGIAKWANYALGIDGTNEDNKPFAAPVQNSKSDKLTFKLGGVKPVAGTGATVTYGVAEVDSPSATAEPTEYVGVGDSIELKVPNTVKYYRIKTKIDQTQTNN